MDSGFDFAARLDRTRREMAARGIEVLLLSVGADLPYLTGYEAMPLERLTMLVLPTGGDATLVVPRLEAPRVEEQGDAFALRPWEETEDPVAIVAGLAGAPRRAAIGDTTWSAFLVGLQAAMPGTTFSLASEITRRLRARKEAAEVEWLRRAGAAADRVAARLAATRFSGRRERDVAREIGDMLVEEGHDTAAFAIVASGPNGASPHHEPGERVIESGDAIVADFGGRLGGYHSDTTRNFCVGEPPDGYREAFAVLQRAQDAAVAAIGPGIAAEDVDRAARSVITDAGYGEFFVHRTGHGIGLDVHEHPYIVSGNTAPLEPGNTFSVEPGIYLPGAFGMRIEDIVVVTDDGGERLNHSRRDPAPVE